MASVNQSRPNCVNQLRKTHSKPLAARHGRGTAWKRHAMCESALTVTKGHFRAAGWTRRTSYKWCEIMFLLSHIQGLIWHDGAWPVPQIEWYEIWLYKLIVYWTS